MTSAAVLFYGRRSRSSSRSFNDLGLASPSLSPFPSSSSSSSCDSNTNNTNHRNHSNNNNRHHNRRGDLHRRHRHITFDDPDQFRHPSNNDLHHSPRFPLSVSETHQGGNPESPSQDINNRETVHGVSGRYYRNNRLPGAVLLAKERLVQRLRSVSVRENRETAPNLPSNNLWVVDADWETNVSREEPDANALLTELPVRARQESSSREPPQMKPVGLTHEALSQLHHEVFVEHKKPVTHPMTNESSDCSICLESFVEGNKLISLPCGHRFHSSCLYPWLQTCGKCPYCRSCIKLT